MKRLLSSILFILIGSISMAQSGPLNVSIEGQKILIGEQMNMRVELRSHVADTVLFPTFADTLIKEIEILSQSKIDTAFEGSDLSLKVLRQTLVLTSFDSGYYAIAPIKATVNGDTMESNPFLISVETIPIDTAKGIYDIRGIAQAPFSLLEWLQENWWWMLVLIFAITLAFVIFIWWNKRPELTPVEKIIPARPAHEIALERLQKLEAEKMWQADKIKEYYSELTDILREYIELRFQVPALEQTTDEIMTSLKRLPDLSQSQLEKIKRLLFLADLVKFAKEKPVGAENDLYLNHTREFINDTKRLVTHEKTEINSKEEHDV
jgi:hypothetical protein